MKKKTFFKSVLLGLFAYRYMTCFTTLSGGTANQLCNLCTAFICLVAGFWVAYSLHKDRCDEKYKKARRRNLEKKIAKAKVAKALEGVD